MAPKALQMVPVDVTKFRKFILVDIHPDMQLWEDGDRLEQPVHKTTTDGLPAWKFTFLVTVVTKAGRTTSQIDVKIGIDGFTEDELLDKFEGQEVVLDNLVAGSWAQNKKGEDRAESDFWFRADGIALLSDEFDLDGHSALLDQGSAK